MNHREFALLVSALLVAATVPVPTGSLSAVAAERSVSVAVVSDSRAYLGIENRSPVRIDENETEAVLLTVSNDLPEPIELRYTLSESDPDERPAVTTHDSRAWLDVGQTAQVVAEINCENTTDSERITVDVVASGDDTRIALARDVTVECV